MIGGRYELVDVLGRGAGGEVWRAHDIELQREVAVKLLEIRSDEDKARVWREVRLATLLGAKGAVPIYDYGDDGTHCFLVMELVQDPTLRAVLDEHPQGLPVSWLVTVGIELMRALGQAHALSVVHRDIKPENVFIHRSEGTECGTKLVDFGLAFLDDASEKELGRLTEAPALSGTPAYLSPEQGRRGEIGPASDVYSAGCVLYELACGSPPFSGDLGELISKQLYVPAIPLLERDPKTVLALSSLVDEMLRKDAQSRPTAADAEAALSEIAKVLDSSSSTANRGVGDAARADRMLDAVLSSQGATTGKPLSIWLASPVPPWLSAKILEANLAVAVDRSMAVMVLAPIDSKIEFDATDLAVVGWSTLGEPLDLVALIRDGFRSVVVETTPATRLRRVAQGLVPTSAHG